jgi:DNA-binding MarR family transcriptional regulator
MTSYPTLSPRVIGQAEKTLNAFLNQQLAGTGVTEPQWVILTLTVTGGGTADHEQLARRVAGALKISEADAQARVGELVAAELLRQSPDETITVSDAGQQLHRRIQTFAAEITERLWGDLPDKDLATTGRVLAIVTERASALLASSLCTLRRPARTSAGRHKR